MENCGKFIKKAKIGVVIVILISFIPLFKEVLDWVISTIIIFGFGIVAMTYITPYLRCLDDNNKIIKK